jgi:starvation-inducible DNA-binding protein
MNRIGERETTSRSSCQSCPTTSQFEGTIMAVETTVASRIIPGLDYGRRAQLVASLNQNLASLSDLAAAYKQAHWNVIGTDFSQLHTLFDQLAEQTRDFVDTIAERAVTIGGTARGTIQAASENSALPAFPLEERCEDHLLEQLVARIDILDGELRQAMNDTADEMATQDVYIEIVRGIEKQRWMLQAHLARRAAH